MTKEWLIGKQIAKYDEEKKVLYLILKDHYQISENVQFDKLCSEVFKDMVGKRNVIIDMRDSRSFSEMSKEDRNALKDQIKNRTPTADKYAIIGASPSIRMFAKILLKFSGIKHSAFFKTEEKALEWFNN
jgi:hypothetical protein